MASRLYDEAALRLVVGGSGSPINPKTDTLKVLLLSEYTYATTHQFVSDVLGAGTELSCTGYARVTLAGPTITKDTVNNQIVYTFTNPVWTNLGPATGGPIVAYAVIYKDAGSGDASNPVIAVLDPADLQTNGGQYTLQFDATNGAWNLMV